jgi:LacI family transcriptional regulator
MHACDSTSPLLADEIRSFVHSVRVDGVILTPPLSDAIAVMDVLDEDGIPFVRIAPVARGDTARSVFANDRESSAAMTRQLAALGHRRIAFIVGPSAHAGASQRYIGYCDGLRDSGLSLDPAQVVECDGSLESALESSRRLLRLPVKERPTAIFAGTDLMAVGALHAARECGIAVPAALSVAGFGDDLIARQVWPTLSTIRQPLHTLARQAAELLLSQLNSQPRPTWQPSADPALVLRRSTAAAPGAMR